MSSDAWSFEDSPNTAVFTTRSIVDGRAWIQFVSHDADDGAWQFRPPEDTADDGEPCMVGLGQVVERDVTVAVLSDLPLGWCAWRESEAGAWNRAANEAAE